MPAALTRLLVIAAAVACGSTSHAEADPRSFMTTSPGREDVAPDTTLSLSGTGWAGTPRELEQVRKKADGHTLRLSLGLHRYDVRRARIDSAGITFKPGAVDGVREPVMQAAYPTPSGPWVQWSDEQGPPPLTPPVPWSRIDHVHAAHPSAMIGGLCGLAIGSVILALTASDPSGVFYDNPGGPALAGIMVFAPTVAGIAIGACVTRWHKVWDRPSAAPRTEAPAASADTSGAAARGSGSP